MLVYTSFEEYRVNKHLSFTDGSQGFFLGNASLFWGSLMGIGNLFENKRRSSNLFRSCDRAIGTGIKDWVKPGEVYAENI